MIFSHGKTKIQGKIQRSPRARHTGTYELRVRGNLLLLPTLRYRGTWTLQTRRYKQRAPRSRLRSHT